MRVVQYRCQVKSCVQPYFSLAFTLRRAYGILVLGASNT